MQSNNINESAIAEAAIWVARLQSDHRARSVEAEFRSWLEASEENRAAFEATNDVWDLSQGAKVTVPMPQPRKVRVTIAALAACLIALFSGTIWYVERPRPIETAIGEQRTVSLPDGSKITLNTDTEILTRFSEDRRLVVLRHGEASFEVAHDTLRPFVVDAGGTQVVAVGTVFDVRWTDGKFAVTLAEGKVRVVDRANKTSAPTALPNEIELAPGQRLEKDVAEPRAQLASVDLSKARAWCTGHVVFADAKLGEAAEEMNRYSAEKVEVEGAATVDLTVSGAFRAGDSPQFARAIAELYGLRLEQKGEILVLSRSLAGP